MSRYLQNLVMRSLGEVSGLSPRTATRYESAQQSAGVEFTEFTRDRSFQDLSSWTSPIENGISHVEGIVERGSRTDASLRAESGRELIRQRLQDQFGIMGEKSDEGEVAETTQAELTRPPVDSTQASGLSGTEHHIVLQERAAKLLSSVPRPNAALSDRREASAIPIAERLESLPGMRNRAVQPATVERNPPSVRSQDVLSDSLRPTLNEVSLQPVRGEMIAPPTEAGPPVVQIRIGRIEVRAVEPPVSAPNKKLVETPRSSVSLDQYLKRRSQEA